MKTKDAKRYSVEVIDAIKTDAGIIKINSSGFLVKQCLIAIIGPSIF